MALLDYLILFLYLFVLLFMGYRFRHNADQADYFLGGRRLGWKPLTLSIMATQLSAISFVSAPAFVGLRENGGLVWLSYELALPLAMLFLLWCLLPVLHQSGVLSVYDFLEQRFALSTRLLISFVFQISRAFATGIMIYAISIILQGTMGLALWQSIVFIGVVTLIYSLQGGMKAVVYGDAMQMILIVLGALICLAVGLYHIGGFGQVLEFTAAERLQTLRFSHLGYNDDGFGLLPMLMGGFVLYAAYYGCDQSEAQRALSAKSLSDLRKIMLSAALLRFPITLIYCFAGLTIGALAFKNTDFMAQIPADNPDWLVPTFIVHYLPTGLVGLLLVAMLAAAMSSLSSAINSLSVVSVQDINRISGGALSESKKLLAGRVAGLFWGIVTLILSFQAGNIATTVIEAINKVGSMFYGPILALFVIAMSSKRPAAKVANIAVMCGVGLNLFFWLAVPELFWFWWNLTGFATTFIVASLGRSKPWSALNARLGASAISRKDVALLGFYTIFIFTVCLLLPPLLKYL